MDSGVLLQAQVRAQAQAQADELEAVREWMSTIKGKDEAIAERKRAAAPRAVAPAPAALTSPLRAAQSREGVAEAARQEGNVHMAAGDFRAAAAAYTRALAAAPSWSAYANRAQAHASLKEHRPAVYDATAALRLNPTHVKSWYRRAAARNALGLHAAAERDLLVARLLEPANRSALVELRKTAEMVRSSERRAPDITLRVVATTKRHSDGQTVH
jgi:tetratricopeptide (TPR) repeat protein